MSVRVGEGPAPGIATLGFANPPVNVLDLPTIEAMAAALCQLPPDTAAVLIRSPGSTFSAGVDVAAHAPDSAAAMLEAFHGLIAALLELEAIPVAVVQGPALGGGCELALACDLVVASAAASFGQPEIEVGCYPPVAAALLPERIGPQLAADMVYSGRRLSAAEAAQCGLVSRLASVDELERTVDELAGELARKSRAVLRVARRALIGSRRRRWQERIAAAEEIYLHELIRLRDADEGVRAFLAKRAPRWRHE